MTNTVRLAKRVAEQLACSRAEADQYIEGGWVTVDDVITELAGARVDEQQRVSIVAGATLSPAVPVTILLNKPVDRRDEDALDPAYNLITAETQSTALVDVKPFLQRHARNLTLTTRLDLAASGLLVLSQDFRVVRKLVEEANRIEHEYAVDVTGTVIEDGLARLQRDASWNGKPVSSLKISWQSEQRLRFAVKGAQVGMIAHFCSQLGLQVKAIKRIRIGRVSMASLPIGQWRYLRDFERF